MDTKQATIIIILLAAIVFVLLAGRTAAVELLGNLFWVAVAIFIVAVVALLVRDTFSNWLARSRATDIGTYPSTVSL